jgi:sortase A
MNQKKRKIIRVAGIVLIVAGICLIAWPFYTNIIMKRQEIEILSSWDEQVNSSENSGSEISENQDFNSIQGDSLAVDPLKKIPFKITIPSIESEWIVNEGTGTDTLKKGPGHYTGTALPGESGRCVIAGHRTTYGAPFNRADELKDGDSIIIETAGNEEFIYYVTDIKIVPPTDVSVLKQTENETLALTTCTPKFYATNRLIVYAELRDETQ